MGLFPVDRVLGQLLVAGDRKEEGIATLQRALEIGRAAGLPDTEEIKNSLDRLGD